jgi:predicted N-acyltransferase
VKTQSLHWIQHPEFEQAIQQFLTSERQHIDRYFSACDDHTPFKALDDEITL